MALNFWERILKEERFYEAFSSDADAPVLIGAGVHLNPMTLYRLL